MFCRNCGKPLNENQVVCLECGVRAGEGKSNCPHCGAPVNENASVCLSCGCSVEVNNKANNAVAKSNLNGQDKTTMILVCFLLGGIGIHNFMMGEKKRGIYKILFSLLCGIGGILALIDLFKLITDKYVVELG